MGTSLSKESVLMLATKLSIKKSKKYKKFRGRNTKSEFRRTFTSTGTEAATGPGDFDERVLTLDHASVAQPQLETCYWNRLPTELKLQVFSYASLIMGDPVRHPHVTGTKYHLGARGLCLVNQEFQALAKDIWYKNNTFVVAPTWVTTLQQNRSTTQCILTYPSPKHGNLIRRIQIELTVHLGYVALTQMLRCQATDWRYLLRSQSHGPVSWIRDNRLDDSNAYIVFPANEHEQSDYCVCGRYCTQSLTTTQWQDHFPLLDELKVNLRVGGVVPCISNSPYHSPRRLHKFRDSMEALLADAEIAVRPKEVEVHVHCECEHAGMILEDIIKDKVHKRRG